jgi:hypothetical protein
VHRVLDDRIEPGNIASQDRLMKARSNLSKVGVLRLLDQVKALSSNGRSIRHDSLMKSLKALDSSG